MHINGSKTKKDKNWKQVSKNFIMVSRSLAYIVH